MRVGTLQVRAGARTGAASIILGVMKVGLVAVVSVAIVLLEALLVLTCSTNEITYKLVRPFDLC